MQPAHSDAVTIIPPVTLPGEEWLDLLYPFNPTDDDLEVIDLLSDWQVEEEK
jgi:hypothetical protein